MSWPAAASLVAGLANLYLLGYLWRHREAPGARWFLAVAGVQLYWGVVYGVALLVFEPGLRRLLELAVWLAPVWIGVFYLAFALAYTGRGHLLSSLWFRLVVAFAVGSSLLVATNPVHGVVWTDFAVEPVFGAATVTYTHEVWVYVQYFVTFALASTGVLVLLDTVASYGSAYRGQAVAIALTPVPPAVAFTLWVFQVGPYWQLNLTAVAFLPHVVLDLYALFRAEIFEFNPATRRAGERAAVDDLGSPVAVVDEDGRVVTVNDAAEAVFGVDERDAFARPLDALLDGGAVDLTAGEQCVEVLVGGRRATFTVTPSPLRAGSAGLVGYTVVFADVTDELRREQRLDVLNRVLRHNLRNDMGVVRSYATAAAEAADDEAVAERLETVESKADGLVALGEKAREVERILASDRAPERVVLAELLGPIVDAVGEDHPEATVTLDCPDDLAVTADRAALRMACANLVENAAEHGGESVSVRAERSAAGVGITVADDGPGIPAMELEAIEAGEETPLQHGSGLGLWVVHWLAERVGASVDVETDDGGTRVSLVLPG